MTTLITQSWVRHICHCREQNSVQGKHTDSCLCFSVGPYSENMSVRLMNIIKLYKQTLGYLSSVWPGPSRNPHFRWFALFCRSLAVLLWDQSGTRIGVQAHKSSTEPTCQRAASPPSAVVVDAELFVSWVWDSQTSQPWLMQPLSLLWSLIIVTQLLLNRCDIWPNVLL